MMVMVVTHYDFNYKYRHFIYEMSIDIFSDGERVRGEKKLQKVAIIRAPT